MLEESVSNLSIWASMSSWFTPTVLFLLLNLMIGTILFRSSLSKPQQNQDSKQQNDPENPTISKSPPVLQRMKSNVNIKNFRSQEAFYLEQTLDSNTHYPSQNFTQEFQSAIETHTSYIFQQETVSNETQFVFEKHLNEEKVEITQIHESEYTKKETQFEEIHDDEHQEEEEDDDEVAHDSDEVNSQFVDANLSRTISDTKPASGEFTAKLSQKMKKSASTKSPFAHFEESDIVETRRPATARERTTAKDADQDEEVDAKADNFISKFRQQLKLQRMDSILRYREVISRGSIM